VYAIAGQAALNRPNDLTAVLHVVFQVNRQTLSLLRSKRILVRIRNRRGLEQLVCQGVQRVGRGFANCPGAIVQRGVRKISRTVDVSTPDNLEDVEPNPVVLGLRREAQSREEFVHILDDRPADGLVEIVEELDEAPQAGLLLAEQQQIDDCLGGRRTHLVQSSQQSVVRGRGALVFQDLQDVRPHRHRAQYSRWPYRLVSRGQ